MSAFEIKTIGSQQRPKIVSIIDEKIPINKIKELKKENVDILEFRIDALYQKLEIDEIKEYITEIRALDIYALLATIRENKEIFNDVKLQLFDEIIPLVDIIDIEIESEINKKVINTAKTDEKIVIVSFHDYEKTPTKERMQMIIEESLKLHADIVKLAVTVSNKEDLLNIINVTAEAKDVNLVTLGMGEYGKISRIILPVFGSIMAYGFYFKSTHLLPLIINISTFYNHKLNGDVTISGAKNAALPLLAATILMDGDTQLKNVPHLTDIITMIRMLKSLSLNAELINNKVSIKNCSKVRHIIPYELITKMRASFFVAGPVLAKTGMVKIPLPGGCAIGARPVDLHLKGFKELGATVDLEHGFIHIKAKKLKGADIFLAFPSVGATENIMMAATLAEGDTTIRNAAKEPEIVDLGKFLNNAGAKITGVGTEEICIKGVSSLKGNKYSVVPDRIEAGTFMVAAALTGGKITLNKVNPGHLMSLIEEMQKMGISVDNTNNTITVKANKDMKAVDIQTAPYPGFPTDMQPQMVALLSLAKGTSVVSEKIFENRFIHAAELGRMGANIKIKDNLAIIEGTKKLSGATVVCPDLRAGAALWLAALAANGESIVDNIEHVRRGYEKFEEKLIKLGAQIESLD